MSLQNHDHDRSQAQREGGDRQVLAQQDVPAGRPHTGRTRGSRCGRSRTGCRRTARLLSRIIAMTPKAISGRKAFRDRHGLAQQHGAEDHHHEDRRQEHHLRLGGARERAKAAQGDGRGPLRQPGEVPFEQTGLTLPGRHRRPRATTAVVSPSVNCPGTAARSSGRSATDWPSRSAPAPASPARRGGRCLPPGPWRPAAATRAARPG